MSDDTIESGVRRDRSPNYPKLTLERAIDTVKRLYAKLGKGTVKVEVASAQLGYSGLSGSALTVLGALNQYGLVDRKDGTLGITAMALRILHPVSVDEHKKALQEVALAPSVYGELYSDGYQLCPPETVTNVLIQKGFTPEGAAKAAQVFAENMEFANLKIVEISGTPQSHTEAEEVSSVGRVSHSNQSQPRFYGGGPEQPRSEMIRPVLARFSVPLGGSEVFLSFHGEELHPEDFDALKEYVDLFKKQFLRKQHQEKEAKLASYGLPFPEVAEKE